MYLLIDNYDSFTYNLYQAFAKNKIDLKVYRNDAININQIRKLNPEKIIISSGPKTPKDAGISNEVIKHFYKTIPILGICLGFQCIGVVFGAKLKKVGKIVHGKVSEIYYSNDPIFEGVPNPFQGARYHSLMIDPTPLTREFDILAWTKEGICMGIKHKRYPLYGLLFHPESFMTKYGDRTIRNFIKYKP